MRYRNTFCIAGTDTDVGKTVVTSALLRSFASKGFATRGIKPVQTGCLNLVSMTVSPDVEVYREACPDCQALALECLVPACSPHLAARMDKRLLSVEGLVEKLDAAIADQAGVTLIEGAGGLYVPLNEHQYIITLFQALRVPVVLVAANRLGVLNHLLLSLEALRTNGIPLGGVVLTMNRQNGEGLEPAIAKDNLEYVTRLAGIPSVVNLDYIHALHACGAEAENSAWDSLAFQLSPLVDALLDI